MPKSETAMNAGFVCNRRVVVANRTDAIVDVARLMRQHHVGTVIVVDERGGQRFPAGIITDRDITISVVAEDIDDLRRLQAVDIMSFDLVTAKESDPLDEVLTRMRTAGVRRVPVIDEAGALTGILALDDLLEIAMQEIESIVGVIATERRNEEARRAPHT